MSCSGKIQADNGNDDDDDRIKLWHGDKGYELTCTAITFWRVLSAFWHGGRVSSCSEMGGKSSPIKALTQACEASLMLVRS